MHPALYHLDHNTAMEVTLWRTRERRIWNKQARNLSRVLINV